MAQIKEMECIATEVCHKKIYIYEALRLSVFHSVTFCLSPGDKQFVCPPGTNISYTQERGGQTFLTHRREGGTNISHTWGEASKLSAEARIFRGP